MASNRFIASEDAAMRFLLIITVMCLPCSVFAAEDPVFSGPQVGERLVPFQATGVLGKLAGKKIEVLGETRDGPAMIVFVHQITRPSIGLLRTIVDFGQAKEQRDLQTFLVFLAKDKTEMEATIRSAQHALPKGVEPLISVDGAEGPGAYGLNRKMTLTVLIGHEGKVTANFPLIQPSVQADAPRIGHAMVQVTGGTKKPTLEEMGVDARGMMANRAQAVDRIYRRMMQPVIQKSATKAEVDKAAQAVEALAKKHKAFRARVAKAATTIVQSGRLSNYGTADAQAYLKKWAREFVDNADDEKRAADKDKDSDGGKESSSSSDEAAGDKTAAKKP